MKAHLVHRPVGEAGGEAADALKEADLSSEAKPSSSARSSTQHQPEEEISEVEDAEWSFARRSQRSSVREDPEREPSSLPEESPRRMRVSDGHPKAEPDMEPVLECSTSAQASVVVKSPAVAHEPSELVAAVEDCTTGDVALGHEAEVAGTTVAVAAAEATDADPLEASSAVLQEEPEGAEERGLAEALAVISPVRRSADDTSTGTLETESDSTMDSSESASSSPPPASSRSPRAHSPHSGGASSPDGSFAAEAMEPPRPGQESLQRNTTMLGQLEESELRKTINIIVPEGLTETRVVTFVFESTSMTVTLPEGVQVGDEVPVLVARRPPLERSAAVAHCRGHSGFPDKTLLEPVRHGARGDKSCKLADPEFKYRYDLYGMLRVRHMHTLLSHMPEEDHLSCTSPGSP